MSFNEKGRVNGVVKLTLRDAKTGEVKRIVTNDNFVSKPGVFHVLDRLYNRANVGGVTTGSAWCALGTGSEAEDLWAVELTTEVSGAGNPGRKKAASVTRTNQDVLISTFYSADEGSGLITEAGLFMTGYDSGGSLIKAGSHPGSGVMFSKATFAQITKDTSSSLTVDWSVSY